MSEDTTQQLLVMRVDRLISVVEESNTRLLAVEAQLQNVEGRLQNVEGRLQNVEGRLQNVEGRLQNVEGRLQNVEEGQTSLRDQMETLDTKVEKRLQNTRPIWENVQSSLGELDAKVDRVQSRLAELDAKVDRVQAQVAELDGKVDRVQSEMDARFTKLETDVQALRTETASGFRANGRKIGVLMENLVGLTVDVRELQDRIEKIESNPV